MENVTAAEKYLLCALKYGYTFDNNVRVPLIITTIIEMALEGNLEIIENNKIVLTDKIPTINYHKHVYDAIKCKRKNISIKTLLLVMCEYRVKEAANAVRIVNQNLINKGLIKIEYEKRLFSKKENIIINNEQFNIYMQEINTQLLREQEASTDVILLTNLLYTTKYLEKIFTKSEIENIKKKFIEMNNTIINEKIKLIKPVLRTITTVDFCRIFD